MLPENVQEYRRIKLTSKRQFTIPKAFLDRLGGGETFLAYLMDDGIYLKPQQDKESMCEQDRKLIIQKVIDEGYKGKEMVDEIVFRLNEYDKFLKRKIEQFEKDILEIAESDDDLEDEDEEDMNGLDVFFDTENEEDTEEIGEKTKATNQTI